MADYAELVTALKSELEAERSAVIGFGGSYGAAVREYVETHSYVSIFTRQMTI